MNEEAIGVLYELAQGDGYSKTLDEFKALMQSNEDAVNDMYSLAQSDGYTKTIDEFQVLVGFGGQVEKKNPNDTLPSDSVTETTDSTIVTEENDGVSDSLSEEITYLDDELQELVDTAEIVTIPRAGVSVTTFPKDGLKTRILSDPNIKAALDGGTLSIEDIDAAIAGDADIIKQLQKTSVKGSQVYQDEIDERNLNAKYNYLDQSNLIDKSPSQETIDADANQISLIIDKVNAFQEKYGDEITQRIDNIENEPDFTVEKFVAEKRLTDQSVPTEEEFTIASENMSYLSGEKTPVDYDTGYEGEDIDSMYDVSRLKQVNGFTAEAIKDFDGYLNAQGYKEDYKRLLAGETISEDGRYYDFSGNYNPTLAAERLKAQYLTNYINNQIERNVDSQILNYKLKNNGRHPVADGVQINFDSGVDDIALSKYIEEEFPTLTANLKAQDVKNEENYQSYLDGDNPWFRQMFKQGWRSVADRINSFSAGVYDFIGLDSAADEIRMRDAQNDLERDDFMRYTYTDGDKAIVNGREYGVDKRGQVYDLEIKKRVTNVLTPVQLQDIRQTVQNEGTPFYSFSAAGAAVQTSGIAADLVLQIGLTRGVGNLGKIASVGGSMFGKTKKVVDILKKVPMKGTTSSAMIAQGMLFSTNLGEDAYKRAINAGISIKDAERIQQIAASQGFVLGSLTAPISTQTYAMNKIFGKTGTEKITKSIVDKWLKGGEKGVINYFQRLGSTIKSEYPRFLLEGAKEIFQENVQQVGQTFVIAPDVNEVAAREIMNNTITGAEFYNTTILAGLAGILVPGGSALSSTTFDAIKANYLPGRSAIDRLEALHGLSNNVEKTTNFLNAMVTKGVYTTEQVESILSDIDIYRNTINSIPSNLKPETALSVMNNLFEINKLKKLREQRDETFHPQIDSRINELRNDMNNKVQWEFTTDKGKLQLKEQAGKELTAEAEKRGEKNFEINDTQITQRAIENFAKMPAKEKLNYVDQSKVKISDDTEQQKEEEITDTNIKTDDNAIQKQETGDLSTNQSSQDSEKVETEVRESSKETQEKVTPEETVTTEEKVSSEKEVDITDSDALNQDLDVQSDEKAKEEAFRDMEQDPQLMSVNEEAESVKTQIRQEIGKAKNRADYRKQQTIVLDKVNSLVKSGKISTKQGKAIINRIKRTSFDNDNQVQKLLDYTGKVFADADYAAKEKIANDLSVKTRKRLNSGRLGNNAYFNNILNQLLSTDINTLKVEDIEAYNDFMGKIAKRNAAQKLDKALQSEAEALLNKIKPVAPDVDAEFTYDENKGFVYKPSTQQIIENINDPNVDGKTLLDNNQEFIENNLDKLNSVSLEILVDKLNNAETEQNKQIIDAVNDYAKNRQLLINNVDKQAKNTKTSNLNKMTRDQSVGANTLVNISKDQLGFLSGTQLEQLQVHLDNISDGIYTHPANTMAQRIEATKRSFLMKPIIENAVSTKSKLATARSRAVAGLKTKVLEKTGLGAKGAREVGIVGQMIRSNPLSVIDQLFGNYKNNTIRENALDPTANAYSKFKTWINEKTDKLTEVENLLDPKRFSKETVNQSIKRRFEITTYLLGKEFEANQGKKGFATPKQFIEKTIEKYNQDKKLSRYNEGDIKILKEILSDYSVDGEISLKKMEDGMDARTKKAINILEDVYNGLGEMQFYATAIVRGDAIDLINSYVHHKVDNNKSEEDVQLQNATEYMNIQPGSKSKTSIARTPGAKAIDFDPISTALRGVRNTGLDYYLSNEISTTRQSLAENIKIADRNANEEVREVALDLKKVYNEALGNVISSNMSTNVAGGKILDASRRIGYYAALASVPRAVAEFSSNLAFSALSNPGEAMLGMSKYKNLSFNETGRLVVQNTGATTNTKLYNDEQLGGSKADQQGIVRGKKSRRGTTTELGEVTNKIGRYLMVDKGLKSVEKIGEYLISTPDQMISRPLWFGTFAKTFKQETGNEVDFDKIADNDSDYMEKNREAIKNARNAADKNVTQAATSNSPFSGVLKNQISDTDSDKMNYYRTLNAYMARFSLNEYATARQAFASMIGKGQMGQIQGFGTLAGVLTRMSMYVLLYRGLSNAVLGALGFGEDDEDLESLATSTYRQAVGAATSILTRGMTGNIPMLPINMAIEKINEEYGFEFGLRDQEEYDPYKNSLIFSAINNENFERNPYKQIGIILSGPLTPQIKSAMRILELSLRSANNKTKESREKNLKELISEQTLLEIFNMVGLVPFYRDIRSGMLKEKYKAKPEELEPLTLEEMKKLDPRGYKKLQQKKEDIKNSASYKRQERLFKEYNKKLKSMELQFD